MTKPFRQLVIETLKTGKTYDGVPLQAPGVCSYNPNNNLGGGTCIVGALMRPEARMEGEGAVRFINLNRLSIDNPGMDLRDPGDTLWLRELLVELQNSFDRKVLTIDKANKIMDEHGVL